MSQLVHLKYLKINSVNELWKKVFFTNRVKTLLCENLYYGSSGQGLPEIEDKQRKTVVITKFACKQKPKGAINIYNFCLLLSGHPTEILFSCKIT